MSIEARLTAKGERRYDVRLRDLAGKTYMRTFRTRRMPSASKRPSKPTRRAVPGSIREVATFSSRIGRRSGSNPTQRRVLPRMRETSRRSDCTSIRRLVASASELSPNLGFRHW